MESHTARQEVVSLPVHTLAVDVVEGPEAGASTTADGEQLTIGAADGNALKLTDTHVSR
jgi:hypothetical protein